MKPKQQLTERQAWLKIRAAYNAYTRTNPLTLQGLCFAVYTMREMDGIDWRTNEKMYWSIREIKPRNLFDEDYYWPLNAGGAKQRVKAIDKILKRLKDK